MDNKTYTTTSPPNPPVKLAPDYRSVYANFCRTTVSPWDISLTFGQLIQIEGKQAGEGTPHDMATIIVSPAEAKVVAQMLDQAIRQYESIFGEIKDLGPTVATLVAQAQQRK